MLNALRQNAPALAAHVTGMPKPLLLPSVYRRYVIEFGAGQTPLALVANDLLGPRCALAPQASPLPPPQLPTWDTVPSLPTAVPLPRMAMRRSQLRRMLPPARSPGTRWRRTTRCSSELAGGPL